MQKLEIFFEEITTKVTDFFDELFTQGAKTKNTGERGIACTSGAWCENGNGFWCKGTNGEWAWGSADGE